MKRPAMSPIEVLAKLTTIRNRELLNIPIAEEEYERLDGAIDYYIDTGELVDEGDGIDVPTKGRVKEL